jgi:hypothetical protein
MSGGVAVWVIVASESWIIRGTVPLNSPGDEFNLILPTPPVNNFEWKKPCLSASHHIGSI